MVARLRLPRFSPRRRVLSSRWRFGCGSSSPHVCSRRRLPSKNVDVAIDAFSVGPHNAKLYRVDRHEIDDGIVVRAAFASRIAKRTA